MWSLLTHCFSIALLWLGAWSFLLINSLCTGWGAPHVWKTSDEVDEWKKTWNLFQERAQVPLLSVSKDRECLAVKTWTAKLSSVPKSSWAPLSPLVCLYVHAWPAALLPQTTICCEQCRHYCWMFLTALLLTVTLFIQEEEANMCAWSECPPLRSVPSGRDPPPCGNV